MGPLNGYTVLELAGIGPAPMTGMMLADMGAEVIRIERAAAGDPRDSKDVSYRGKKSVVVDLKNPDGVAVFLQMVDNADVLIDPYRPGVCEKLGIGPEPCLARNPKLIYGRMTGWGQGGPLAQAAGHDINYISLTGALHATGRAGEKPVLPLNLVGDMGGGGMLLMSGILAALLEATNSGQGQVIDAAMVDGAAQLMWMMHGFAAQGMWNAKERGVNLLDGGAFFYDTYACADGKYISIGAIEPQFYATLVELAGLDRDTFANQYDSSQWPAQAEAIAKLFETRTQSQWCELLEGTDACFAPVLSLEEAPQHSANIARKTYVEIDGVTQPAPAPRFSRTPSTVAHGARALGADTDEVLASMGISRSDIDHLKASGAVV